MIANDVPVAPEQRRAEDDPRLRHGRRPGDQALPGGGKSFVGPARTRSSSTSAPLRRHQHRQAGRPDIGSATRAAARTTSPATTHSFVLQVPEAEVTRDRKAVAGADAAQRRRRCLGDHRASAQVLDARQGRRQARLGPGHRLGNPLINEVIIPIGQKDKFNRTHPADDARTSASTPLNPEPARLLNALFNLGVKETDRTDIVQALLTGVPGLTQIGSKPAAADTLKLNLGVPPSRHREPLRRPRGRHRRLPERPPSGR